MKFDPKSLLPYEDNNIISGCSKDEILTILSSAIGPKRALTRILSSTDSEKFPFQGFRNGDTVFFTGFNGKSSFFSPKIEAIVSSMQKGCSVRLKMRLSYPVLAFMAVWLGFSGLAAAMNLIGAVFSGSWNGSVFIGVVIPALMFLWGYVVCFLGFWLDSHKSKAIILKYIYG